MENMFENVIESIVNPQKEQVKSNVKTNRTYLQNQEKFLISYIVMFIVYMLVLSCGSIVGQGIASEKINKIFDIMSYKVSPAVHLYGKVFAVLTLCLQVIALFVLEVLVLKQVGIISDNLLSTLGQALNIGWPGVFLIFIFVFLGCLLYTLLFGVSSIFVTSQEQQQFALLPVRLSIVVAFFTTAYLLINNNEILLKYSIYIPFISPFTTLSIILSGAYQWWELVCAGGIFICTLVIIGFITDKVILPKKLH